MTGRRTVHPPGTPIDCTCPRYVRHVPRHPIPEAAYTARAVTVADLLGGGINPTALVVWHLSKCRAHMEEES